MPEPIYLAADAKLPYCRGCGHALVVRQLSRALEGLKLPPRSIVLTTDIGCVGLADALFPYVHTVHTTHGRSTAMATGMALAEVVAPAGGLKPIVMIGDGGAMIGLLHLVHAAQLNVDITVLLHNNFLFGMTGGQHSAFTPLGWVTATTPAGNLIPPLDLLALLRAAQAGFLARQFATDSNLDSVIAEAIAYPGFSLVEIVEVCTGYSTLRNKATGNALREVVSRQGQSIGKMQTGPPRLTFSAIYQKEVEARPARQSLPPTSQSESSPVSNFHFPVSDSQLPISSFHFPVSNSQKLHVVIAGTAGERVQSSAALLCRAALSVGLYSTEKNDNPVTHGSGFSLAEICLSPQPIEYTGIESVDVVIAVSQDGWSELRANGTLAQAAPSTRLVVDAELVISNPAGRVLKLPFRREATPQRAALAAIAFWLGIEPVLPHTAWDGVLAALSIERRQEASEGLRIGSILAREESARAT